MKRRKTDLEKMETAVERQMKHRLHMKPKGIRDSVNKKNCLDQYDAKRSLYPELYPDNSVRNPDNQNTRYKKRSNSFKYPIDMVYDEIGDNKMSKKERLNKLACQVFAKVIEEDKPRKNFHGDFVEDKDSVFRVNEGDFSVEQYMLNKSIFKYPEDHFNSGKSKKASMPAWLDNPRIEKVIELFKKKNANLTSSELVEKATLDIENVKNLLLNGFLRIKEGGDNPVIEKGDKFEKLEAYNLKYAQYKKALIAPHNNYLDEAADAHPATNNAINYELGMLVKDIIQGDVGKVEVIDSQNFFIRVKFRDGIRQLMFFEAAPVTDDEALLTSIKQGTVILKKALGGSSFSVVYKDTPYSEKEYQYEVGSSEELGEQIDKMKKQKEDKEVIESFYGKGFKR